MTNEEAVEQLMFDMNMIIFDSSTGKTMSLEEVKMYNKDNYKTYIADVIAIEALKKQIPDKAKCLDNCVLKCPSCGKVLGSQQIIFELPCRCGQLIDYSDCD